MEHQNAQDIGRQALEKWKRAAQSNPFTIDKDFQHSIEFYLKIKCPEIVQELSLFGEKVATDLEPLVIENNLSRNLPYIEHADALGKRVDAVVHHPTYEAAGNIIYQSRMLKRLAKPGGLLEALAFMFLSSQAGEAGHNCPVACSAGMIRVLQKTEDFPKKAEYLEKLTEPNYSTNYTAAQFVTEIQGGSDVGLNAVKAVQENGQWRIYGEKWFCSNADAELMLVTARFDPATSGTKGVGLFLVPAKTESEENHYKIKRLKDKIGTRSLATAEIDFEGAAAIPVGALEDGFKLLMENVLHISRLFNTVCVLGMGRRAYFMALAYAQHRLAFGSEIINYPLVLEHLARIKAENTALLAAIFGTVQLQDEADEGRTVGEEAKLLLRLCANINKYISALWSVDHIHHALDILAGNGAIESFSTIPRLLRDSIVCENWEGTHNTLRMQILRDIARYRVDLIFVQYLEAMLSKIKGKIPNEEIIEKGLDTFKEELKRLKEAPGSLQSLLIKSVVDKMAILFSALQLGQEAVDQKKSGCLSKQKDLEYFVKLHLGPQPVEYDDAYLKLIQDIVQADL